MKSSKALRIMNQVKCKIHMVQWKILTNIVFKIAVWTFEKCWFYDSQIKRQGKHVCSTAAMFWYCSVWIISSLMKEDGCLQNEKTEQRKWVFRQVCVLCCLNSFFIIDYLCLITLDNYFFLYILFRTICYKLQLQYSVD